MEEKFDFDREKLIIRDKFINYIIELDEKHPISSSIKLIAIANPITHNYFSYYPLLFQNVFPHMPLNILREISLAANLYMSSLLITDTLVDQGGVKEKENTNILYAHILHQDALRILYSIFASDSFFWQFFQKYYDEYIHSFRIQAEHHRRIAPYDSEEMEKFAKGKSAVAKNSTAIYYFRNEDDPKIRLLEKSQDYFHIGLQLIDDLQDWKQDLKRSQFTNLLTKTIHALNWQNKENFDEEERIKIGKSLVLLGTAERSMESAVSYLKKSLAVISDIPCTHWKDVIIQHLNLANNLAQQMRELRESTTKKKEKLPKAGMPSVTESAKIIQNTVEHALELGFQAIMTDKENDYIETKHVMSFPKEQGFVGKKVVQEGDLFQRSLICETSLDAKDFNYREDNDFIESEAAYLASRKLQTVAGGWSYFPDLPELPPDADDLAQMIRIFVRTQSAHIKECEEPLNLLIEQNMYPNHSFSTWIVDHDDFSDDSVTMRNAVYEKWGIRFGLDVEVTANMIISLQLLDPKKYNAIIGNAQQYLQQSQQDGSWYSEWYVGDYYGIYICTKALQPANAMAKPFDNTYKYLLRHQNTDGGWGLSGRKSDSLSSSLALLSLFTLQRAGKTVSGSIVDNGIRFLLRNQNDNGTWEAVSFIQMLGGRYIYQSPIMTTNFALRALLNYTTK